MKRFLIGALLAGAWANTANAEDYDWSGIYGGVSIGARWSDRDFSGPFDVDYWSTSGNGVTGGAFVGYNFSYGNLVLGPEISALFTNADGESKERRFGFDGTANSTLRTKATASVNARVGYSFGRILPYVTAGYSRGWFATDSYTKAYRFDEVVHYPFERNGWNVGVGTDWAILEHVFARAEYRFIDFGKEDIGHGWEAKYRQHAATLGIGYKF
ncbi:outer membrane protein [Brucella anthropi]|uniref:outer membrane protein n=1 Tax=Brucella anthropi TaxID=529 RepID=UPI0002891C64|nr:outer membrane protein [Brucella anthropi]